MDQIFDDEEEASIFAALFLPYLAAGFEKGMEAALLTKKPHDVFTDSVRLALKLKAFTHATQAVGTTKDELQSLIGKAIEEGQSTQQLAKSINDQFAIDSRVRSLRIARTELTDTINDGTVQTLAKEGYREKQWSTVIDGRERETHAAADGQSVPMDGFFTVGGETCQYPGDENLSPGLRVNCRCVTVAGGLPADRVRQLGERFLRVHGALERSFVLHLRREFERQRRRVLSHFPA